MQAAEQDWYGTPDASCSLILDAAKIKPFFESSSCLSWLVRPHSRKPHREVDLQKVSTRSQASISSHQANERPGPPAVLLWVTQGLHAEVRHSSHFAKVTQEEAWGVLNYSIDLACSFSLPEEKKTKYQQTSLRSQSQWSNSTTQDNEGLKPRQIWSTKLLLSFITERHVISGGKPMAYDWFSMKNHCLLIPWSSLQYLLCPWRLSFRSPVSE